MPLTTPEICAKLGLKEDQPLYLLAYVGDEDGFFQGYGATPHDWIDGKEGLAEYGCGLYVFTSAEKAEEFANKKNREDPAYPAVYSAWSDSSGGHSSPSHIEAVEADLREIAYAVAYYVHPLTLLMDAGPVGEGRYIPLEDLGWSRELVKKRKAIPVFTHLDRFFGETAEEAERAFREGRAVENYGTWRLPAHLAEMFFPMPPSVN